MAPLPSWEEIEAKAATAGYLAAQRSAELLRARERPSRQFSDRADANAKLLLWRDDFGWCPFSHQAQFHLEEKGVAYQVCKVPLTLYRIGERDKTFLGDSPDGMVPALRFLSTESRQGVAIGADDVRDFIEDHCDGPPLVRCAGVSPFMVKAFLELEDSLEKQVHNFVKAAAAKSAAPESEEMAQAMQAANEFLLATLEDVNFALEESHDGPYFFGQSFTVVDIAFAPWVDRAAALLAWLGGRTVRGGRFKSLDDWWAAMEARPAHQSLRLDEETIVRIAVASQPVLAKGLQTFGLLPPTEDAQMSGAEAAQCLAVCRAGVAALASRRAPQATAETLDKLLRLAAAGTLGLGESPQLRNHTFAGGEVDLEELAHAAIFVRSRLAVPRDMSAPAAGALRRSLEVIAASLVGKERMEKLMAKEMASYGEKLNFLARI